MLRGNQIDDHSAPMTAQALARHLQRDDVDVELVASTASTNADLIDRARTQAPRRPLLRAAWHQSAGRGRLGRAWRSCAGGALLFSIALPWRSAPAATSAVTLACGLAVAQCLRAHGMAVTVKWPNDILFEGRKLAGILTEIAEAPDGARTLVIGMGMNLVVDAQQRGVIDQPVAELAEFLGREAARNERESWLARFAGVMIDAALAFEAHGFAAMRAPFNACFAYLDQPVELRAAGGPTYAGIARGVDGQGRLLLECEGAVLALINGEMSLRAQAPGGSEHKELR